MTDNKICYADCFNEKWGFRLDAGTPHKHINGGIELVDAPPESRYDEGWACEGCAVSSDGCPHKVKPLSQYLDEYIEREVELGNIRPVVSDLFAYDSWRELLEQALDAYQSTENVTIKIERNK